ncbi:Folylpolyglutamate synthetase [Orbilia brochopaga]|uniref:Folylpolyglutamate synthase n=1 Tax=Orbilia brochopaga TaxID=3140254 RepID=A0AAV9USE8_9PEZI
MNGLLFRRSVSSVWTAVNRSSARFAVGAGVCCHRPFDRRISGSVHGVFTVASTRRFTEMASGSSGAPEERTYADAITALNGLQSNFAVLEGVRKDPARSAAMAMPEMLEWLRRAGYQPSDFDCLNIIHIAGTKGKGSTCAFITSILRQYSTSPRINFPHKIGTYTSPHLKAVRERIQIDGQPLSEPLFAKYFFELYDRLEASKAEALTDGMKPMYFRFLTMLAFHVYLREGVDTVVLEVGVGGEYDSTNVVLHPTVTGITSLGVDHVFVLGDTIEKIAWHKAGILKSGAAAFTVPQEAAAMAVIEERAREKGVQVETVPVLKGLENVRLGLAGDFQKANASLAVKVVEAHMRRFGHAVDVGNDGESLPDEVRRGLEQAVWKGRCQVIEDAEGKVQWCIDGAHTRESIAEAGKWFASVDRSQCRNIALLFNQQTRNAEELAKDLNEILKEQLGSDVFTHVYFTTNRTYSDHTTKLDLISINVNSAAVDALAVQKGLAKAWGQTGSKAQVHVMETIQETVEAIRALKGKTQVLVTGSLHLVGGFLELVEGNDA